MTEQLEDTLRRSLRSDDPGELFTRRVMQRLPAEHRAVTRRWLTWSAGLAASLLLAIGIRHQVLEQREQAAGLRAKRELLEALRVTSGKLDLAYQAVDKENET
jgi:hypothetical protein